MYIKIITVLFLFVYSASASSYYRFGKINNNFTYEVKSIEEYGKNRCKLILEIENNSNKDRSISKNLIAHDVHRNIDWKLRVNSGIVRSNDDVLFEYIIYRCKEVNPFKIIFR